jgi:hypothetical protein
MAFSDPITFAYDAGNITLNRVSNGSFSSVWYGVGTNLTVTMTIKHTVPAVGSDGESHLCRVDVDHFDSTTGAFSHRSSAWTSIRTDGMPQNSENSEDVTEALVDFLSDANITKLVTRQS